MYVKEHSYIIEIIIISNHSYKMLSYVMNGQSY